MTIVIDYKGALPILAFAVLLSGPCELPEPFYDRRIRYVEATIINSPGQEHIEPAFFDPSPLGAGQVISMSTASVSGLGSVTASLGFTKGFANVPSLDIGDLPDLESGKRDIWLKPDYNYRVDYYNRSQEIIKTNSDNTMDADYEIVEDDEGNK